MTTNELDIFAKHWQNFANHSPAIAARMSEDPLWLDALARLWCASEYAFKQSLMQAEWLDEQRLNERLQQPATKFVLSSHLQQLLAGCNSQDLLKKQLRLFRNREMLALLWRIHNAKAELAETLVTLSAMADLCVQQAVAHLTLWQAAMLGNPVDAEGKPMSLLVLALGKLGGYELNLSSDIDLIFAFKAEGELELPNRSTSYSQYFTRLGKSLIAVLNEPTEHGFVFRVDMRLRPYGDAGPLVGSFTMLEQYYQRQGREWERYALQKARVITGSLQECAQLLQLLRPFIYRRYIDFSVLESLREMKALIQREALVRGSADNIKIGTGGIREIEFIAQALQLIHGGKNPTLQNTNLLQSIQQLQVLNLLGKKESLFLQQAYTFLRTLEHTIQGYADQQTHQLPQDPLVQQRQAQALGFDSWDLVLHELSSYRQGVSAAFNRIVALPKVPGETDSDASSPLTALWDASLEYEHAVSLLEQHGIGQSLALAETILAFVRQIQGRKLSAMANARFRRFLPILWQRVAALAEPAVTLKRVQDILNAIYRRSSYIVLLIENPSALGQLLKLCSASPWFSEQISKYPLLLDELLDHRSLYAILTGDALDAGCQRVLERSKSEGLEVEMDALRTFKQAQILHIAACDVTEQLPLMKVSDRLTELAEVLVLHTVRLAAQQIAIKNPKWEHILLDAQFPFAICAYGKLAGYELGYASDLDLVFLYDSNNSQWCHDELAEICLRLSQRVMHLLTTATAVGELYKVDTRLRPAGDAGLLVTSMHSFFDYQKTRAWTWEHQALVRSRMIVGPAFMRQQFLSGRACVLSLMRDKKELQEQIVQMRDKLAQMSTAKPGEFDLKYDRGGITDIEFLVQYWVLRWGKENSAILEWPDNIRILESLVATKRLGGATGSTLIEHYKILRSHVHRLSLQNKPPIVPKEQVVDAATLVISLWQRFFGA